MPPKTKYRQKRRRRRKHKKTNKTGKFKGGMWKMLAAEVGSNLVNKGIDAAFGSKPDKYSAKEEIEASPLETLMYLNRMNMQNRNNRNNRKYNIHRYR